MTSASVNHWIVPTDHAALELRRLLEERYANAVENVAGVVYEAGCGHGYGTTLLATAPRVSKVIARDIDAEAVAIAVQHTVPKVSFGVSNIEQDPVPPCDWVVCTEVMGHLHLPHLFLDKLKGAARIGIVLSWEVGKSGNQAHACEFAPGKMSELMIGWNGHVRPAHERGPGGRILATYEVGVFVRPS